VKPLQYFCLALPVSCLIHQRKLLFWENINSSDNLVLRTVSRYNYNAFIALGSIYNVCSLNVSASTVKDQLWTSSVTSVNVV